MQKKCLLGLLVILFFMVSCNTTKEPVTPKPTADMKLLYLTMCGAVEMNNKHNRQVAAFMDITAEHSMSLGIVTEPQIQQVTKVALYLLNTEFTTDDLYDFHAVCHQFIGETT